MNKEKSGKLFLFIFMVRYIHYAMILLPKAKAVQNQKQYNI